MNKNGQSAASNLTENQLQVFLTGKLGDGCIATSNTNSTYYCTNCKFEEYIDYKSKLLNNLFKNKSYHTKNGYCKTPIYTMRSCSLKELKTIKKLSLQDTLNALTDLGIALWFYDDGSLHKVKNFYNLNTQKFSEQENKEIIAPYFLNRWGIKAIPTIERKKDGREFWYLRIGKYDGAFIISEILKKYYISCYSYKIISSETIQKWSKLQEELKSIGKEPSDFTAVQLAHKMKKISL